MIEKFCKSILQIEIRNSKALANIVMGLASQTHARSVVETSLSSSNHYQHTSINKVINSLYESATSKEIRSKKVCKTRLELEKKFISERRICRKDL